jgi:hypothetical protein
MEHVSLVLPTAIHAPSHQQHKRPSVRQDSASPDMLSTKTITLAAHVPASVRNVTSTGVERATVASAHRDTGSILKTPAINVSPTVINATHRHQAAMPTSATLDTPSPMELALHVTPIAMVCAIQMVPANAIKAVIVFTPCLQLSPAQLVLATVWLALSTPKPVPPSVTPEVAMSATDSEHRTRPASHARRTVQCAVM